MSRRLNFTGCLLAACAATSAVRAQETPAQQLAAHTAEFRKEVIEVTDGVHVAVGFGLANSILIEGSDGVIIVDTMESRSAAAAVKAEFDKITTKPVRAIVYTHNHYDHVMGATVFAGDSRPEIYAHESTMRLLDEATRVLRGAIFARSARQFGLPLRGADFVNAGIGPRLVVDISAGAGFLPPTVLVGDERLSVEVAGVRLELVHAPGETADQIYIWLPDKKVLLPGDNFYKAFPNLYAIRGTSYRDPREWVASLDKMIAEQPEHLVPSHTRPLSGAENIRETLTNYRNAIAAVVEQTIAGMNRGLTPDQLVREVKVPPELMQQPYLQEFYGTVPWSVRSIYAGSLGWFDGNATNLFPLSDRERAERTAKLAGGAEALLAQAKHASAENDFQWTAELADHLIALDAFPIEARELKADALTALGQQQTSANGRNYYLTSAQELRREARELADDNQ